MIKNFLRKALLSTVYLSTIVWLSGCAISNEGAVDYRKAEPIRPNSLASTQKKVSKAQKKASKREASPLNDKPLYPAVFARKDLEAEAGDAVIENMDKVSIHLREGFLSGCNDKPVSNPIRMFGRGEGWRIDSMFWKNCEIAILFRAFEMSEGNDFNFESGSYRDARLVYFSHDVQANQLFNLHNLPVYGPLNYAGKPIGIEIFIIEIDTEDQEMFTLLKSLAAIGAQAYAPAAPVLGVLDKIGGTLMSGGTDDIEYRYTMVLDPSGGYKGVAYSTAEAGDYVFIRREDRTSEPEWSQLVLDHNTGRVWKKKENNEYELYRDDTYLTVQIRKNAGTDDVELAQHTYGALQILRNVGAAEPRQTQPELTEREVTRLTEDLKQWVIRRDHIKNLNRAQKLYERMVFIERDDKNSENKYLARQAAFDLYNLLKESIKGQNAEQEENKLSSPQIEYLLEKLRRHARLCSVAEMKKYSVKGFGELGPKAFVEAMVPTRAAAKPCAQKNEGPGDPAAGASSRPGLAQSPADHPGARHRRTPPHP